MEQTNITIRKVKEIMEEQLTKMGFEGNEHEPKGKESAGIELILRWFVHDDNNTANINTEIHQRTEIRLHEIEGDLPWDCLGVVCAEPIHGGFIQEVARFSCGCQRKKGGTAAGGRTLLLGSGAERRRARCVGGERLSAIKGGMRLGRWAGGLERCAGADLPQDRGAKR